ncbi:thioesterase [Xenophilus sp. AP218F]|nr:PaaI family thioesterase [Chromobacterium sp. ASV5]OWY37473.1 thioesterase [Xenophilus sp. AP218F]
MSQFMQNFAEMRERKAFAEIVDSLPYVKLMGVEIVEDAAGELRFDLPFAERNVGNTALPALHGGLIGGFLESAAMIHLMWNRESLETPKIVDFSLDYLRSGKAQTLYAKCEITKQGRRVANVLIEAWQDDRSKPVAVARAHFLLSN